MKKKYLIVIGIVVCILLSLLFFFACNVFMYALEKDIPHDEVVSDTYEAYSFSPSSVLLPKKNEDINLFTLEGQGSNSFWENRELPETYPSVYWKQTDYIVILEKFLQETTNEGIDDWNTTALSFRLNCEDASSGPQKLSIDLARKNQTTSTENNGRQELNIDIFPKSERFLFWKRIYDTSHEGNPYLDLDEINISAEEVLKLAEANGGNQLRKNLNNSCSIQINIGEAIIDNDWRIKYRKDGNTYLEMFVDEKTGEIHKLSVYDE